MTLLMQDQGEDSFRGLFSLMCLGGFFLGITLLTRLRDIVPRSGKKSLYSFQEASQTRGNGAMLASEEVMTFKSYQNRANLFVKEYLLADSLIPYTSVISGMLACKMVFDLTQLIGSNYFKIYSNFSKIQRIEWNNR
ncbi:unnamed protein product [Sphenostylis stenocarpa]|uniref:Uncharacterized protein n=1 Tax=Sphenostylis stenocarpa TaxID=92480 RepID=A0AA86T3G1_9FABA|nr:unnamed protein product [Sphenostylis stenocarpa]